MRSLISSSLCVCAMFATGFNMVQEDIFGERPAARPVPPAPPAVPARLGEVQLRYSNLNKTFGVENDPFDSDPVWRIQNGELKRHDPVQKAERSLQVRITKASKQLKSDDAATKEKAQEELTKAVGELFDLRSKTREKQIKDLEQRLARLRKQMDQREDKKSDIIRLHLQTIVNQANGLGF